MYKNNKEKYKKIIFSQKETRRLHRLVMFLFIFLVIYTIAVVLSNKTIYTYLNDQKDIFFGKWDILILDSKKEDISYFENHAFIYNYSIQLIQECITLEDNKKLVIGSGDQRFLDISNITFLEGTFPKKNNEVAVEEEYLSILGVEKVGDVISNYKFKSLNGFIVCGIIKNYTTRWNMINDNVNFVNCFIHEPNIKSMQIYVDTSPSVQEDIITNVVTYNYNLIVKNDNIFINIIFLWLIVLNVFIFIFFQIRKKIKMIIELSQKENRKSFKNIIFKRYILYILLKFLFLFQIIFLASRVIFFFNYKYISYFPQLNDMDIKLSNVGQGIVIETINLYQKGSIKIIPNRGLNSFVESINIACIIILLNYIIVTYMKYKSDFNYLNILKKYYYNDSREYKIINKYTIIEILISNIMLAFLTKIILYQDSISSINYIFSVIIVTIIYNMFLLLDYFIVLRNKKKDDNQII
ncbi:hypothetical protein [Merdibacter massiliensis]|uniref:hypothetical protein n=1 Tax=Merdibacter massiliensis TaxID=1871030 RepID=UPI00096A2C33|nr:hypothetical protein [Merdibacter massiliensis]